MRIKNSDDILFINLFDDLCHYHMAIAKLCSVMEGSFWKYKGNSPEIRESCMRKMRDCIDELIEYGKQELSIDIQKLSKERNEKILDNFRRMGITNENI